MKRAEWEQTTAYLPVHLMNWRQLRYTVVYEPARRELAWLEMLRRSARVTGGQSQPLINFMREHGQ